MNKLKILNTVALLVVVATPTSQASMLNTVNEIIEIKRNTLKIALEIADQRNEAIEQINELVKQRNERLVYVEKLENLVKEQKELIDNYIFNRGYNK